MKPTPPNNQQKGPRDSGLPRLAVALLVALLLHGLGLPATYAWIQRPTTPNPTNPTPAPNTTNTEPTPRTPTADLALGRTWVPPKLAVGLDTPLRFEVINRGLQPATLPPPPETTTNANATTPDPWWSDAVYLSQNDTLDPSDPRLALTPALNRLTPNAAYDVVANIQIPADTPPGQAFLILVADDQHQLPESQAQRRNNQRAIPVQLRPAAEQPDDPQLGRSDAPPRVTLAWIAHDDFQTLKAGPEPSPTVQPLLQAQADPTPNAPLRNTPTNTNTTPTPPTPTPPTSADEPTESPRQAQAPTETSDKSNAAPTADTNANAPDRPESPTDTPLARSDDPTDHADDVNPANGPPPATPANQPPTTTPTPTPTMDATPPTPQTDQPPAPTSAPRGPSNTDPADVVAVNVITPGQTQVSQGLTVHPARPEFSIPALITTVARNPRVRITFDTDGSVLNAQLLDSAGSVAFDAPLQASLYRWRAAGEELTQWDQPQTFQFTLLLNRHAPPNP